MLGACQPPINQPREEKGSPMSRGVRIHVDAHHCLEAGGQIGKIVVTV
jgi:hypothetical protein